MSDRAYEQEDVALINKAGKKVKGVQKAIHEHWTRYPTGERLLFAQWENELEEALSDLRRLRAREQAEAEGRAP